MAVHRHFERVLATDGIVSPTNGRDLNRVRRAVLAGELRLVLPGAYARADAVLTARQRARALMATDPTAVLTGRSAAWQHGWRGLGEPPSCRAATRQHHRAWDGFDFERRTIPERFVVSADGLRATSLALTALDLVPELGGAAIDEALLGGVDLEALWNAFRSLPQRPGNRLRAQLLHDSRDRPWSEAERAGHRALRAAGVRGWTTNHPVVAGGHRFLCDLAFVTQRLAIEIDGRRYHDGWERRANDSARDRLLAAKGWLVLRFPALYVMNNPEGFVREILDVLAVR